jgi:hypothetical protein
MMFSNAKFVVGLVLVVGEVRDGKGASEDPTSHSRRAF